MIRQLRSELTKLATVRATIFLALATIAIEIGFKSLLAAFASTRDLDIEQQADLLKPTLFLPLGVALVGVLSSTAEFRYGYAVPTVLARPQRTVVAAAKALVAVVASALTGAAAIVLSDIVTVVVYRSRVQEVVTWTDAAHISLGSIVACALLGLAGVGVGLVITGQIEAVVATTLVLFVVTPLTSVLGGAIYQLTPGGAIDALADQREFGTAVLAPGLGGALLAGYAAAVFALGCARFRSREL
jgi:hypothetical protein